MIIEKNRYLIKAKIFIGNFFASAIDDVFIELREPTTRELYEMQEKSAGLTDKVAKQKAFMMAMIDLLPSVIVTHNIFASESVMYKNDEVVELVLAKIDLFQYVVTEYYDKVLSFIMPSTVEMETKATEEVKTV